MSDTLDTLLAEAAAALADSGLFAALGRRFAEQVLARASAVSLEKREVLFNQGDEGTCAYVVLEGALEVVVDIGLGGVQMAVIHPYQLVGEIAAFGGLPRTSTVVARQPSKLLRLEGDDMLSIIAADPEAGRAIIAELGRRLTMVNQPLAFLSIAAQALQKGQFDPEIIATMAAQASGLGPFAKTFQDLVHEIQVKQIHSQEMAMAATIQESVLPKALPEIADQSFDIQAFMRPMREVGGDLYDFFMVDDQHLAFAVADVSGKGVPAALFMVMFHTLVKAVAVPGSTPDQVMARANAILSQDNEACMFITVFFGIVDLRTGLLTYCNAGHNAPYLLSPNGGRRPLPSNSIALGIVPDAEFRAEGVGLLPGDTLFLFTDGVTEAFSAAHEQFGEERLEPLLDLLAARSPSEMVARVVAEVDAFAAGREQFDDITCLALTCKR